ASEIERLQILPERRSQLFVPERELDRRLQKTELFSGIVASTAKTVRENPLACKQAAKPVRELDLSAAAPLRVSQDLENSRLQDIATNDSQVRRGFVDRWLLDHIFDLEQAGVPGDGSALDDAVP